jgi:hypothetical protein
MAGPSFVWRYASKDCERFQIPYAELRRTSTKQNASVACPDLQKRWPEMFRRDPYYNPNLASGRADFSLGTQANSQTRDKIGGSGFEKGISRLICVIIRRTK